MVYYALSNEQRAKTWSKLTREFNCGPVYEGFIGREHSKNKNCKHEHNVMLEVVC